MKTIIVMLVVGWALVAAFELLRGSNAFEPSVLALLWLIVLYLFESKNT